MLTSRQQATAMRLLLRWANLAAARELKLATTHATTNGLVDEEKRLLDDTRRLIGVGGEGGEAKSFGWTEGKE